MNPHLVALPESPLSGVRLWSAQIESLPMIEVQNLARHLDGEEQARAERFHFERDRTNYVATRGLLRCLLAAGVGQQNPAKLAFKYGEHGKPALNTGDRLADSIQFSVSHSGGWAMFAVSPGFEVGIDLEAAKRLDGKEENLLQLAGRILSVNEMAVWQSLPIGARPHAFLRAWTRKEAWSKATGRGLLEEIMRVEVALDAAAPKSSLTFRSSVRQNGADRTWSIHDLWAPEGFAAALAVEENAEPAA